MIVIPGIMGSELIEAATNRPLWGLADPRWYLRAWTSGSSLEALRVSDAERAGHTGRIIPSRLLRFPVVAPLLRGFEPYTALLGSIRRTVAAPEAVLPFPYDWRLSVAHNASRLAEVADDHLRRWRQSPRGSTSAKLILVAHSMGGLIASYFTALLGGSSEVRIILTLGTPFRGSVKAVQILNSGVGTPAPLPHRRLRQMTATMPGLHELLPSYRCVADGAGARPITPAEVADIGGDAGLAEESARLHQRLAATTNPTLQSVVGLWQPTAQTFTLIGGVVTAQQWSYPSDSSVAGPVDRGGDETVARDAASSTADPFYVTQTHGALARTPEVIDHVRGVLTDHPPGAWLGESAAVSLQLPDVAVAGEEFRITLAGVPDPASIACRITDAVDERSVAHPLLAPADGSLEARITLTVPGVYRIAAKGQSFSPVTQLLMAIPRRGSARDDV
ncbi:lipase/acyltransferase domain-containing protein [Winogradskya humida]|uniref:lipase/acyltransferase domain-containing protein n=1 Tax=Winogradskya humida TaxID=113566 RepID=UPI001945476E|nr:hypothetical protein [Actinoplanes humidus]